jgi:hypothetical protein
MDISSVWEISTLSPVLFWFKLIKYLCRKYVWIIIIKTALIKLGKNEDESTSMTQIF